MPDRGRPRESIFRLAVAVAIASVAVAGSACGDSVSQVGLADIAELRLSPDSALVAVGGTLQMRALPLDSTGALLVAQEVSWSSTDAGVASVDADGLVTGVSSGSAEIVVAAAGFEARSSITVAPPPRIVLSADTVRFSAIAGGADPAPDSVLITTDGVFALNGLSVDSVTYGAGARDWLIAQLTTPSAPAGLNLAPMVTGVTTSGEFVATVWLFGIDAENNPAPLVVILEIMPGAASALQVNDGDAQTSTVGQVVPTSPSVRVVDAFGNGVAGEAVAFAVTGGGGTVTGGSAVSDAAGVARVGSWTLGTTAGANTLSATLVGSSPVSITATGAAGSPSSLTLSAGDGQTAVAGSAISVAPAVVARDGFGNGVDGVSVLFTVTSGGGSVTGSPAASTSAGLATVGSWVLGSQVGPNSLIATVGGVADTISFSATGVTGSATTIGAESGDAQSDTIGATLSAPYAVKVADANGNGVSGATVTWAVTGGGGSIGTLSTTGSDGVATATHTLGVSAGPHTVSATVVGLSGSPVAFASIALAGAPTSIAATGGDAQTGTVGVPIATAPSVVVLDRSGNPASGVSVTFTVTGGGGSVGGGSQTTDASGAAQAGSWTLGTAAGANTLSASVAGLAPIVFTATGVAGSATQLQLSTGDNQSSIAGTALVIPPSVIASDQFGNGVDGVSVQFTVTSGGGSVTGASPTTAGGGIAAVGSWTVGPSAGANTLLATVAGIADSVTFTATALSGTADAMLADGGDAQTDTVGATLVTPYSVRVVDSNSNGVAGIPVTWTVTGGGGSITPSSVTGTTGVATAIRVLGTGVGTHTATASVGGLTNSPIAFAASATAGAPALASVNGGNAQSATVGTAVTTAPSILVTDQFSNPLSGVTVTFAVTGGGGSVSGGAQVTGGSGIATLTSWTLGTTAGANALSATPAGVAPVSFTATGTADVAAQLVINAGNNQSATAGSPVAVQPAAQVLDQFGNPVQGEVVTFLVTAGGGSLTGATTTSGSNGTAMLGSWTLGGAVGTNTLSATVSGVAPVAFTATGLVGAAASMSLSGGNSQTDTVAATLPTAYAVLVVDANANPVSGTTVTWSATGGGSIAASSVTNASGIATATRVLGTVAGTQTANGSVGGLAGSPVGFTATATAGASAAISVSAGGGQTATVNTPVAVDPQVLVLDQFGNPVLGESVTFSVTGGGGSVSPTSALLTASNGTVSVTSWTLGTGAGTNNNTLRALAASAGVTGNPLTFTATADADAPASIAVTSGNGQTAVTGLMVSNQPTVTVEDQFGNAVSGATVDFSPSGSGSVGTPSPATNGSGIALTTWTVVTSGNPMGTDGRHTNTLTATVQGTGLNTAFSGFARYTYPSHVDPILTGNCTGCHGSSGGLGLNGTAAQNYAAIFDVAANCDATAGYRRVSPVGGVNGADVFSILLRLIDPGLSNGTCFSGHVTFSAGAAQLDTIRAWIRNSAPNN